MANCTGTLSMEPKCNLETTINLYCDKDPGHRGKHRFKMDEEVFADTFNYNDLDTEVIHPTGFIDIVIEWKAKKHI